MNKMTKSEYFSSQYCSEKSKRYMRINVILFVAFSLLCGFYLFSAIGTIGVFNAIDFSANIEDILNDLKNISGGSVDINIDTSVFEEIKDIVPINELFKWSVYATIGYISLMMVLIIIFSAVAVIKKSRGFAITTVALSVISGVGLMGIIIAVAIMIFTIRLDDEYQSFVFISTNQDKNKPNDNPYNNEPDFS